MDEDFKCLLQVVEKGMGHVFEQPPGDGVVDSPNDDAARNKGIETAIHLPQLFAFLEDIDQILVYYSGPYPMTANDGWYKYCRLSIAWSTLPVNPDDV
jgi:hypothetical protein